MIPASCGGVLFTAPNVINPACITGDGAAIASLYTVGGEIVCGGSIADFHRYQQYDFQPRQPPESYARISFAWMSTPTTSTVSISVIFTTTLISTILIRTFGSRRSAVPVDPDLRNRPGYNIQVGWVYVIQPDA